ncbi:MAG TPA: AAA family ATPase [Prolixibacteraceae bacterium]|nr:AAA family ATPase [Prolixibacteraceae bacterium]
MIPIKLTIQGLFSYQEKQTIDFQKLTEAHLFGIFGSVGSGKSSILDAITYALYGETERMNARDNRNYNMMNLKSDELFIEFDFNVGRESTTYRSVVRGKRNRKRFEDVKTLDRSAYKNQNGAWEPIEIEQLQQAIGLSYENFKRTIIIPQGRFQEFLQLGNKDRTQMMKELFNLGKFELYYKTVALETNNNEQMQKLQGQLHQLGEVKLEQLEEAKFRMEAIRVEINQLTSQLSFKQKEEIDLNKLKELVEKLKAQQVQMDFLKTKEEEILKTEQLLKEYEYCLVNYKNLFDRSDEVVRGVLQLEKSIADEDFILNDSTTQLSVLESEFAKIKIDYEQRDLLKQQAGELIKIARIIELKAENQKIGDRVLKGLAVCESSKDKVQKHKILEGVIVNELKTLKASLPDLAELSKIQNWFTIRKSLVAVGLECSKELDAIQKEINILYNKFEESIENQIGGLDKPLKIHDVLGLLTQKGIKTKDSISMIDKNIEHLLIRTKLEEYATNLEDGKPCPLCGSLLHPDILDSGDVKMALQKERDSKMKQEKAIESLDKLMVSLRQIETQLYLKLESIQKLKLKQVENKDKTETHQTHFIWPDFTDELVLNKSFQSASTIQLSIRLKDSELEKLRMEVENEQKLLENYNKGLETIKEQQTINQSEIHLLTMQIEKLDLQVYILQSVDKVKQLSNRLLLKYGEIESAYLKTATEITRLQKRRDESSGKLQVNRSMLLERQKEQIAVNDQIIKLLSTSDYAFADQIKKILNQKIDIELENKRIQNFRQQFQLSENQLSLLIIEVGDRTYFADDHQKVKDEVSKLSEVQAEKNRELGKTEGEIRKLTNDLNQQKQIRKSLYNLELRAEDIKTMKQLFKGSGFVNYVSSVHLHNLCLAANDRFYKLVRQKMSLEITQDNSFQVRDFLNGGKVRSVKTLSGGQTFQAALSLALSLADSIQQFTDSSQNFFFLDEGFGSLDKESLDVVFETLKSLRKENRIVGVISHVEEMQQEIDTHLRIVNDEEIGSRVFRSWEN